VIPPDPARGVFETIRVEQGRALHLEDHLARLRHSVRELYGADVEPRLPDLPEGPCRLRITVLPTGEVTAQLAPLGAPELVLAPWTVAGGLGAHKWADRRAVEKAAQRLGATPLILDEDGSVLEAAWANVWVREGERLLTPPADGRLLPGVTRARMLRTEPHSAEESLTLARLEAADVIVLTSALRGLVEARLRRSIT
jgi:para-aminobenzoate synthetase/4-amino-4-deoxychorismate lyase